MKVVNLKNMVLVFCGHSSLAKMGDHMFECVLPGIHLYDPDTSDDLIHDPHTFVCDSGRLQPSERERERENSMRYEVWEGEGVTQE